MTNDRRARTDRRRQARARVARLQDFQHQVMRLLGALVMGAALLFFALSARAADTALPPAATSGPEYNIQDIIKQQLAAIRSRDADLAYSFMTHDFHEGYDSPKSFLTDMRMEHRAIYNHEDYTFLDKQAMEQPGDVSMQRVRINDHYGQPVTVIYRLERQDDNSWLIDSFTVLEAEAQPI